MFSLCSWLMGYPLSSPIFTPLILPPCVPSSFLIWVTLPPLIISLGCSMVILTWLDMLMKQKKNNSNFHFSESESFSNLSGELGLIELPLLDRRFTWSNMRDSWTLERLDRAFFNLAWDQALPYTTLSSLTRTNSEHIPFKVCVSTSIPLSHIFHFENSWSLCLGITRHGWREYKNFLCPIYVALALHHIRTFCFWYVDSHTLQFTTTNNVNVWREKLLEEVSFSTSVLSYKLFWFFPKYVICSIYSYIMYI